MTCPHRGSPPPHTHAHTRTHHHRHHHHHHLIPRAPVFAPRRLDIICVAAPHCVSLPLAAAPLTYSAAACLGVASLAVASLVALMTPLASVGTCHGCRRAPRVSHGAPVQSFGCVARVSHTRTHAHTRTRAHTHAHTRTLTHTHAHAHTRTLTHAHAHTQTCTQTCTHTSTFLCCAFTSVRSWGGGRLRAG
jgi:hypothetical protein